MRFFSTLSRQKKALEACLDCYQKSPCTPGLYLFSLTPSHTPNLREVYQKLSLVISHSPVLIRIVPGIRSQHQEVLGGYGASLESYHCQEQPVEWELVSYPTPPQFPTLESSKVGCLQLFGDPFYSQLERTYLTLSKRFPQALLHCSGWHFEQEDLPRFFTPQGESQRGTLILAFPHPQRWHNRVFYGCTRIGKAFTISSVKGSEIFTLNDRPAFEVLKNQLQVISSKQRELAKNQLCIGLSKPGSLNYNLRNLLSVDHLRQTLVIDRFPKEGEQLTFLLRDPFWGRSELEKALVSKSSLEVSGVWNFGDPSRGERYYPHKEYEARLLKRLYPQATIGGIFGDSQTVSTDSGRCTFQRGAHLLFYQGTSKKLT